MDARLCRRGRSALPVRGGRLYLAFYPASYTSLLLLARSRTDSFRSSLWLDGAIAALTVAAVIATLIFQPIVDATSGGPAEIAVNLAYPVGDVLLLGLVVAVFGLNGWRPDPVWLLLGGGLALTALADGLYLFQSATEGVQRRLRPSRGRRAPRPARGAPGGGRRPWRTRLSARRRRVLRARSGTPRASRRAAGGLLGGAERAR